jgi:hypothetical protein
LFTSHFIYLLKARLFYKSVLFAVVTLVVSVSAVHFPRNDLAFGMSFSFKGKKHILQHRMQKFDNPYYPRAGYSNAQLDTMSNSFDPEKGYVEIIRQDDPVSPALGLALGFEFDETNGEYPYTPARAIMQLKDFGWGGVEFSRRDTLNYTGVSNDVSEDIQIEVDGFARDTVWGRFSGVLVSGAGVMTTIENGYFRVRVHRK